MKDRHLAEQVATDLRRNLEERAATVRDVYGLCLWADDVEGDFLVSFATESDFDRLRQLPAYASRPVGELAAPDGIRWNVGDWHKFPDDDLLSDATREALAPLAARLTDDSRSVLAMRLAARRWRRIAFAAFDLARPLDLVPHTDDAIAFVGFPDLTVKQQLAVMRRTVPRKQLAAVFPSA